MWAKKPGDTFPGARRHNTSERFLAWGCISYFRLVKYFLGGSQPSGSLLGCFGFHGVLVGFMERGVKI